MKEIKKWKVDYNARNSEEMRDLENRITLLKNHASAFNRVERGEVVSSFDVVVEEGRNHVTSVASAGYPLKFSSSGKDGKLANMQVYSKIWGDYSVTYEVTINGNCYVVGPAEYIKYYR